MSDDRKRATIEDLDGWAGYHAEILDGVLIEKAHPGGDHGHAQGRLGGHLDQFNRRGRPDGPTDRPPGGWWIQMETDLRFGEHDILCPDLSGWRRARMPERPRERAITTRADWVCEILSPSNRRRDLVYKLGIYAAHGIPHYWLVDPKRETLTVHELDDGGYVARRVASRADRVRLEPFEAALLAVGILFGDEPDD